MWWDIICGNGRYTGSYRRRDANGATQPGCVDHGRNTRNRARNCAEVGERRSTRGARLSRQQNGGTEYAEAVAGRGRGLRGGGSGYHQCGELRTVCENGNGPLRAPGCAGKQRRRFSLGDAGGRLAGGLAGYFCVELNVGGVHEPRRVAAHAKTTLGTYCESGRGRSGTRVRSSEDFGLRGGQGRGGRAFAFASSGRSEEWNYRQCG